MDLSQKILSDITTYMKYSKYRRDLSRREDWNELVTRNKQMHIKKFPLLASEIEEAYSFVYSKKILPSMRSMQFGGAPIEMNPSRVFNCAYMPIDDYRAFSESMFLLLGGTGVGFSVQNRHVSKLPTISAPSGTSRRFLVPDSIEGWSDAIKMLMKSYFFDGGFINFDFSDIREKGSELVKSGGKAPGPKPLSDCIDMIRGVLDNALKAGSSVNLRPIEVHDIICHIADAVLAGGIRRAALISLFSPNDTEMIESKYGDWWKTNPQRGRANNSAVFLRGLLNEDQFRDFMKKIEESGSGDPGVYLTDNYDYGTNPCCEISLLYNQFCNLVEINASNIRSVADFSLRAKAAAFIATLQASYTDFHYLRPIWSENTEKDALIGISITGVASGIVGNYDLKGVADDVCNRENERVAGLIGINIAARVTCLKPAGTTSLVFGTSSGIHSWHDNFYIRRIRVNKNEPIYAYLSNNHPEIVKDEKFSPHDTAVIEIPQKAPEGALTRDGENAIEFLERVKDFYIRWIKPGHRSGPNTNNVSATVNVKDEEWSGVTDWMWDNRDSYNGLALLPYDGGSYVQAPFESIDEKTYDKMFETLKHVDLTNVIEESDNTNLQGEIACSGGSCDIK